MSDGARELRLVLAGSKGLLAAGVVFGVVVNLLMFTGPLYMLQVYDRILASGSEATLVALSLLITGLFVAMGALDHARGRVMAILGARMQDSLDHRVFAAALDRSASAPKDPRAVTAQRDLEALRGLVASPVLLALMDLPWTPLFLAAIFVLHPLLGWLSVLGGAVLAGLALLTQVLSRGPQRQAGVAALQAEGMANQMKADADTLRALGMASAGRNRWRIARSEALHRGVAAAGIVGGLSVLTRTFRLFLQSAMLGLGAWLALRGELSAGAMIAASVLMGRVLAPIDVAVGQWAIVQRAAESWHRLAGLLSVAPVPPRRTALPRPRAILAVESLCVGPPGEARPLLQAVSFRLEPGQALGVIGPSGAGKTTLAKALTGVWPPLAGQIRLDGASLDQYEPDSLGRLIGYLPQRSALFDGTVAENIARLDLPHDSALVVDAARRVDAHEMILRLPRGYDTVISASGTPLSGGQAQRVGLARALFGNPEILVLDEPNSNLDGPGSVALNAAIRKAKSDGKAILVMAHRPAAIQECDLLLVLDGGHCRAFGARDQILRDEVRNHTDILKPAAQRAAT